MFLLISVLLMNALNFSSDPFASAVSVHHSALAARSDSSSGDELCEAALQAFMRKTDSDLARHVRPHLAFAIKEASSSPESDNEADAAPSPKKIMRTWVREPSSVRTTPRPELDEVILAAVQRAFEEQEADIAHKAKKIDGMFSRKCMATIAGVVCAFTTLATSLASVYGTMGNIGNCTK